ncbi:MAG: aldehyde dehydrogenase family protein [Eubacteriaceae bacterium]|jgi:aldehyde dehydrogenase (NAD+)|nr:aldehyde dehydrogenase family protein [Eubacteriaceae bacterium]
MANNTPRIDWAKEWLKETKKPYINGEFVSGHGPVMESVNPATNEVIGHFETCTEEDVNAAVAAARKAFDEGPWSKTITHKERAVIMHKISAILREHTDEIATLETMDNGKTFPESCEDTVNVADFFDYYAGWTDKFYGDVNPVMGDFFSYTVREPMGVCGQIIPWNYPMDMAGYKLAPALAMRNTIVFKSSSFTPFSMLYVCELIDKSGLLPEGVFNIITGRGSIGSYITRHPDVDKAAFTGSTSVGRKLVHDSADSNLKRLSLELGGKSANIIFDDAPDMDWAIERSFVAMFYGKGEKCSEPTRLFVQRGCYDRVIEGLVDYSKNHWKVGDPFDPATTQGAQVSEDHFNSIMKYIEIGKQEGGKIVCGGGRNVEGSNAKGFFIDPTIFVDCNNDMRIAREEIFGPVLTVIPFDTEEEVVAMANDSTYGLAAGFWTNDVARTQRVANALQAGQIFINKYGCYEHTSPFGGYKQSGWGMECGKLSIDLYTKRKSIWYAY